MPASSSRNPTLDELLGALDRLRDTDFHEVELRLGDTRLRVARGPTVAAPAAASLAVATPAAAIQPGAIPDEEQIPAASGLEEVTAPMVGTFYRRPRPDAEPFASVGDRVQKGQVLCIIEAMKLMNNIEAEIAGEVVEVVADDGSPVQFGDRLFLIRPA